MCEEEEGNCRKVNEIFEALCRKLSTNNEVTSVSEKFSALNTNADRVSFADDLLKKYGLIPKLIRRGKDDVLSAKYRQEGNEAFKRKEDLAAWMLYTKSIAHAKTNSDCLGLAYANRSAVLYEKKMYKQCLEDITNAFKSSYPKKLHEKLIQREHKARELLSSQLSVKYYEKADTVSDPSNKILCADARVEIRNSKVSGRQVVALKKLELGDVVAVEKPYAQLLLKEHFHDHCFFCLELCYNMIPCDGCVYAMFCTQKCRQNAWKQFHRYECPVLPTLYALDISKLTLLSLRIAIVAKKHYSEIKDYKLEVNDVYKSQHYKEIHFLATNTHLRKSSDLFPKATTAAVVRNVVIDGSSLHQHLDDPKRDETILDELIMRHLQTGPTNFHGISECVEDDSGFLITPDVGVGAYAFFSLFNHSCVPNVVRHCHGSEIIVRAIRPIPKGAELLDNYGYHYAVMKKAERQRELQRQYFFNCQCEACENDWPLYQNLPHRGKSFDIPKLQSLIEGDRVEAIVVLAYLLNSYSKIAEEYSHYPNKFVADLQETIKQCYALLGNRKPKF